MLEQVRIPIIQIGNSKGVRLPAHLLREHGFETEAELKVVKGNILLEPVARQPRAGWDKSLERMHEAGDDKLLTPDNLDLDKGDWEW